VGHIGRVAAALTLIAVLVVPALAAPVPELAPAQASPNSAPVDEATQAIPSGPSPAAPAGSTNPPRPAPETPAGDDAKQGGATTAPAATALQPGSVNASAIWLTATYDVKASLNFGTRSFKVTTAIHVRNDAGGPIDFLNLNTIATRLGGMKLGAVTVDGKAVAATVHDQTIRVPLGGILAPGASVDVTVAYTSTLRSTTSGSNWLFTRANGIADVHRWIPWISRDVPFNRPNHGDPFITPVSPRVAVSITSDRKLVIATTGQHTGTSGLTQTFLATNVRDFAFTAAPDYKSRSTKVGNVTIRVYYRGSFPSSSVLAYAKHAISAYQPLVGPYPYPTYNLAQTAGGYGMESPGLTWIPAGAGSLSYLVHHETAHQWFYGIVGNDQAYEPFTDEAMADMLARYVLGQRRASRCATARLDLSIYRYSTACYYEDIYIQGGNFLDDLRRSMGTTAYWRGIRDFVAAYRYKLAPTKSLLAAIDARTSLNFAPRYHSRFPRLY
jgi:hypothetical protein